MDTQEAEAARAAEEGTGMVCRVCSPLSASSRWTDNVACINPCICKASPG